MLDALYKKKIIRDYLSLYPESKWKALIGYTLEFAVLTLKANHKLASLSFDDIIKITEDLKKVDPTLKQSREAPKRSLSKVEKPSKRSLTPQRSDMLFKKNPSIKPEAFPVKSVAVVKKKEKKKTKKASKLKMSGNSDLPLKKSVTKKPHSSKNKARKEDSITQTKGSKIESRLKARLDNDRRNHSEKVSNLESVYSSVPFEPQIKSLEYDDDKDSMKFEVEKRNKDSKIYGSLVLTSIRRVPKRH